jgi:lipid-binding SYLF domain-containing protein
MVTSWLLCALLFGCATVPAGEREAKRAELDAMAAATLARAFEAHPESREILERSIGYMVIDMKITKIPVFGGGGGLGVVVDRRDETRSYLKVSRFEIGGGLGAQAYKVIVLFQDDKLLNRVKSGAWYYDAGADLAAGAAGTEGRTQGSTGGFEVYRLNESGAVATVTVRVARAKPYLD